ncbi:unnamed protein product [Parnassius apollo]|uniref:(apollo) hypothetical protein n=1 Tax=Parnassius apollo TaxID=110799 RepID=A0A8S3W4U0_PARAO|nr:unnamed protein product [Parnassius apollo]
MYRTTPRSDSEPLTCLLSSDKRHVTCRIKRKRDDEQTHYINIKDYWTKSKKCCHQILNKKNTATRSKIYSIDKSIKDIILSNQSKENKLSSLENTLKEIKDQNVDIFKSLEFISSKYGEMREKMEILEADRKASLNCIRTLEDRIDGLERKARSCSIEMRNVTQNQPELKWYLQNIVRKDCTELNVSVEDREIRDIFRLKSKSKASTPNPIIVEFANVNIKEEILTSMKKYPTISLDYSPGRQSHYSLNDTKKEYLPEDLNIKKMYKLYLDAYESQNHVSYETYRTIFNTEFNISFGYPRTDTCSACDEFKIKAKALRAEGNIVELNRLTILNNLHKKKAQTFYDRKKNARIKSKTDVEFQAIAMDYQKNVSLPKITTSNVYYKCQLSMYSFNIHALGDASSYFYTYPETCGRKGSDEVVSFLFQYLTNHLESRVKHLEIFCDSASGQNKNYTVIRDYNRNSLNSVKRRLRHRKFKTRWPRHRPVDESCRRQIYRHLLSIAEYLRSYDLFCFIHNRRRQRCLTQCSASRRAIPATKLTKMSYLGASELWIVLTEGNNF